MYQLNNQRNRLAHSNVEESWTRLNMSINDNLLYPITIDYTRKEEEKRKRGSRKD